MSARHSAEAEHAALLQSERQAHEQLKAASRRLLEVQENERRALARELHDEIGQLLTGLQLLLESGAAEHQTEMLHIIKGLHHRIRAMSMNLRPPMLDELGLLPALLWHMEPYTAQTGVRVEFTHAGLERRRFGTDIETAAYRIVQEALTNVARHAGVRQVKAHVWAEPTQLGIRIEDQGRGFDVARALAGSSTGLEGMRERARLLRGRLTIDSEAESGVRVTVNLPVGHAPAGPV